MIDIPADGYRGRVHDLLTAMVDIYSPSGKEHEVIDFLEAVLLARGLPVERQEVEEGRDNLIVLPDSQEPHLLFLGHVDTVVSFEPGAYDSSIEDDELIGLGAADMKGGCAALLEAYDALWCRHKGDIPVALALVVGEEENGDGAIRLLEDVSFSWAVIGEPTHLHPCMSNFGYVEVLVSAEGERRHASLAPRKNHPIENMLRFGLEVIHFLESKHENLVFNIRDLYSAPAGFAVPEGGQFSLDIHSPPGTDIAELVMSLEELLEEAKSDNPSLGLNLRFQTIVSGYSLPERGPVFDAIKKVYADLELEFQPTPFRSHSDANTLWESGTRPILLGPGRLEAAHAPGESISLSEVKKAVEIYQSIGEAFLELYPPKTDPSP